LLPSCFITNILVVFLTQKSSSTWHLVEPPWKPLYPLLFLMQRYRFPSRLVALFLALAELHAKPNGVPAVFGAIFVCSSHIT
jgi:hypothetical protein